jgi:hypothetical protein
MRRGRAARGRCASRVSHGRLGALAIVGCLALLVGARDARAQTISSRSWSTLEPGVRLLTGRTTGPTTRFWALEIDLCASHVHMAASGVASSRQTAGAWGARAGVTAAVNGDFFRTDTSTPVTYGQAVGAGRVWPAAQSGEGTAYTGDWYYRRYGWIAFGPDVVEFNHTEAVRRAGGTTQGFMPGRATTGEVPPGTVALVSGFPELVTEGRVVTCSSPTATSCFTDRSDMRARNPRSAMGISEDRRTFWLVAVDGRSSVSAGMYGTELAWLMGALGAWQAFNLDGGGSTTLWVDGRGTVNAPSDGSPRPVANLWGVYAGTASGRPATPGSCVPPDMGMADMGLTDAGIVDGSVSEMGIPDAGIVDASMSEMGIPDAGILDGSVSEMGIRDASGFDAASPDAGDSRGAGNPPHGLLGGCSCRVAPGAKTGNAGLGPTLFAALVAALAVSRRRRAAKSA